MRTLQRKKKERRQPVGAGPEGEGADEQARERVAGEVEEGEEAAEEDQKAEGTAGPRAEEDGQIHDAESAHLQDQLLHPAPKNNFASLLVFLVQQGKFKLSTHNPNPLHPCA